MSEANLFGEDPAPAPAPVRRSPAKKADPPPRKPTKRQLREAAPPPRNRAPAKPAPEEEDGELHNLVRLLAGADMLADEELDRYADVVEPVISKSSRDKMKNWRRQ